MPPDLVERSQAKIAIQFARFCAVGVLNTAIDLSIYYLLTRFAGLSGNLVYTAKAASFLIATLNSYIFNRTWTFKRSTPMSFSELGKFYVAIGSGLFINVGIHAIDIMYFGTNDIISAIIAAFATAVWGFTVSKHFVFK